LSCPSLGGATAMGVERTLSSEEQFANAVGELVADGEVACAIDDDRFFLKDPAAEPDTDHLHASLMSPSREGRASKPFGHGEPSSAGGVAAATEFGTDGRTPFGDGHRVEMRRAGSGLLSTLVPVVAVGILLIAVVTLMAFTLTGAATESRNEEAPATGLHGAAVRAAGEEGLRIVEGAAASAFGEEVGRQSPLSGVLPQAAAASAAGESEAEAEAEVEVDASSPATAPLSQVVVPSAIEGQVQVEKSASVSALETSDKTGDGSDDWNVELPEEQPLVGGRAASSDTALAPAPEEVPLHAAGEVRNGEAAQSQTPDASVEAWGGSEPLATAEE